MLSRQTETETETEDRDKRLKELYAFAGPITYWDRLGWRMVEMSSLVFFTLEVPG